MTLEVRDHVPVLTGLLTVVSLTLVFGAVLGFLPVQALPRPPQWALDAIPHVNAAIAVVAFVVIVRGWRLIRQGRVQAHRRAMLVGLGLFVAFLSLYLYRVALEGTTGFGGPDVVNSFVYLPTLAVHMVLAVVCIPLLFYVALVGLTYPVSEIPLSKHPRIGRIAAALWLTSFAMGTGVYLLLYVLF